MDDTQSRPTDRERDALADRINRVAAEGRISTADRDIRLGNVKTAQSRAELDLMSRDLDVLEATLASTAAAVPATGPTPAPASAAGSRKPYSVFSPNSGTRIFSSPTVVVRGSKRGLVISLVIVLVSFFFSGVLGFIGFIGHVVSGSSSPRALPPAQTDGPAATDAADPSGGTTSGTQTGPNVPGEYALNVRGVTSFLATYAQKFRITKVVDLVLYPDYAVVDVPVAGGQGRQAGWLYRRGSGWTSFGGVRAVFPGSQPVDTRQLDVAAMVRNIARARATLKVEKPTQTYVVMRFVQQADEVPSVDIHVANGFNESGYLATRLDGSIERAYPFGG